MKKLSVDLCGTVAMVTGGSGVLCGRMAKALAANGASVAVAGSRPGSADKVTEEIVASGGKAISVACNVLESESMADVNREVEQKLGPVDILINGAGGNHPRGTTSKEFLFSEDLRQATESLTTFYDLDPQGIQHVFNLNFLGTLLATQVFSRSMAENGKGVIINISSMSAYAPLTKIPAYSGAKAAVNSFTQWLAVHMSKVGVRVNAIAPGFFLTEQNRALLTKEDGSLSARGETIVGQTPMGRFGDPEELIGALLWLVSDDAAFVTGAVIPVDGGFAAFSGV